MARIPSLPTLLAKLGIVHAIWFKWDRLCGTISKFLAFMWDI